MTTSIQQGLCANLPQITELCNVTYYTARAVQPGYSPFCTSPIESGRKGTLGNEKQIH